MKPFSTKHESCIYIDRGFTVSKQIKDILVVVGVGLAFFLIGQAVTGDGLIETQAVAWITNIAMIATVAVVQKWNGESLQELGVHSFPRNPRSLLKLAGCAILALLMAILSFVLGSILMANIVGIPEQADTSGYSFLSGNLPALILVLSGVFVASSFGEELIYRGFLTSRLAALLGESRKGWIWAGIVSSILFGLAHYSWGWMGIVQTTFMGGALVYAWRRFGANLWVVILAHAIMDLILMVQMYLAQ